MIGNFFPKSFEDLYCEGIAKARKFPSAKTKASRTQSPKNEMKGPTISFTGHRIGLNELGHTAIIGASGAGKNLIAMPTLRCLIEESTRNPSLRIFIVETKDEATSSLRGMGIPHELVTFTLKDGVTCDFASDFASPQLLSQLGYTFFPAMEGNNSFFRNGGRATHTAASISIHETTEGNWGIDDLVNVAFEDSETLKRILANTSIGQRVLNTFFEKEEDGESLYKVRSEVATRLWPFLVLAAKYQQSGGQSFSFTDFWAGKTKTQIVVVKVNPEKFDIESPLIQALLQRNLEIIMSYPDTDQKDKIVWIDDFGFYKEIPKFLEASEIVRSKGCLLFILFQSIEGLQSKDSYGDKAEAILANFMWKVMLRAESSKTARWCADQFGRTVVYHPDFDSSYGKEGISGREGERRSVENIVQDSNFLNLPLPSKENGVTCYLRTPRWGAELAKNIPWEQVIMRHPPKRKVHFEALPLSDEIPKFWSPARLERLTKGVQEEATTEQEEAVHGSLKTLEEEIRRLVFNVTFEILKEFAASFELP